MSKVLDSRLQQSIEGIPFIIRFKTISIFSTFNLIASCIEGIPFIIRFKTYKNKHINPLLN